MDKSPTCEHRKISYFIDIFFSNSVWFCPICLGYPEPGSWSSWQCQIWVPYLGMDFKLDQSLFGHSHNVVPPFSKLIWMRDKLYIKVLWLGRFPSSTTGSLTWLHNMDCSGSLSSITSITRFILLDSRELALHNVSTYLPALHSKSRSLSLYFRPPYLLPKPHHTHNAKRLGI